MTSLPPMAQHSTLWFDDLFLRHNFDNWITGLAQDISIRRTLFQAWFWCFNNLCLILILVPFGSSTNTLIEWNSGSIPEQIIRFTNISTGVWDITGLVRHYLNNS